MIFLSLALSACSMHPQSRTEGKDCVLVEGDWKRAVFHPPRQTAPTPVELQFRHGRLAGKTLCERPLTASDLQVYGWVVEVPGQRLAWTTAPIENEKHFRQLVKRCELVWQGQVAFLGGDMIVSVDDWRFTNPGWYSCTVGKPIYYDPGIL